MIVRVVRKEMPVPETAVSLPVFPHSPHPEHHPEEGEYSGEK